MPLSPRQIEGAAELLHASYVVRLQLDSVTSRLAYWGEEFMVPWMQLSDRAKEWNRDAVRDFAAILELLDVDQRET